MKQKKSTVRASRVIQACESCAQNHLRCEHEKPCSRCRGKDIECKVPPAIDFAFDEQTFPVPLDIAEGTPHEQPSLEDNLLDAAATFEENNTSPKHVSAIEQNDQLLPDYIRNMPLLDTCISGAATPRGIMDFTFNWDIDLNDMDVSFLDQYNDQAPFGVGTPSTDTYGALPQLASEPSGDDVSVRHEAFKKSVWRYLPQSNRDFGASEQPNLAFDDSGFDSTHSRSRLTARRAIRERLDRVTRDRLLALVLGTCNPGNVGRIAGAFPSVDLLDGLIQYFLTSPSINARAWFHLPTLSPSNLRPELLASIIAAGAIATPDIHLRKLGFALHEASRAGLAQSFEDDNTSIRDFQHVQALLMSLEIGMWSGMSRKMEIAESFLQPLVTMLRRGGRFRRSIYKDIVPGIDDEGPDLEDKWHSWVSQEKHLRLAYRAFEHDRQSSMSLLKPPLISYSEMQLPLPQSDALWHADTAQLWKQAYFSLTQGRGTRTSSAGNLLDLDSLCCHESASLIHIYMIWGMIWEHRQMEAMVNRMPYLQTNSLVLSSRHQELTKYFENFRLTSSTASGPGVTLLVEAMLMHLNAPLDEIQLFAGIEGQEEARRVYSQLQIWAKSAHARQSLWHAGQILRAAKQFSKGLIRNFNAIAVYHAGLVFWGYSLLQQSLDDCDPGLPVSEGNVVRLDAHDDIETRRFVTLGRGTPALHGYDAQSPLVLIRDMGGIMDSLIQLLKANHDPGEGPSPPLVDNLVQLMEGLRSATWQGK
jgi:hypothetical protein